MHIDFILKWFCHKNSFDCNLYGLDDVVDGLKLENFEQSLYQLALFYFSGVSYRIL